MASSSDRKPSSWSSFLGRLLFWRRDADFEKKLQHLSKEEVLVLTRIKRRTSRWRKIARFIVVYSVSIQLFAVVLAVFASRNGGMSLEMRLLAVVPAMVFPLLSYLLYNCCAGITRMRDKSDSALLEKLRLERKAKIDELKEKTNYYATQQLIQQFDPDPTAKAAAASVLVSKLGGQAEVESEWRDGNVAGESSSREAAGVGVGGNAMSEITHHTGRHSRSNSLRQRKSQRGEQQDFHPPQVTAGDTSISRSYSKRGITSTEVEDKEEDRGASTGWFARVAALLVGEDPTQCYALVCEQCFMHNGLARKEDFPFITYYCPRCRHLNKSRNFKDDEHSAKPPSGHESQEKHADGKKEFDILDPTSPLTLQDHRE